MNHFTGIGRLTKDLEIKQTQQGKSVASFTLAINRSYTNQQGQREADFIQCVIWEKGAENLSRFVRKGSQIGIEGQIQTRSYENQQGGKTYVTEVVVQKFHLLDPKQDNQQGGYHQQSNNNQQYNYNGDSNMLEGATRVTDDVLPF